MAIKTMRAAAAMMAAAASLALAGCISLGPDTPDTLLTLTPAAQAAAGPGRRESLATAIALYTPATPRKLAVTRVPVMTGNAQLAYLQDAAWVDEPATLFRALLAETVTATTGRLVLNGDDPEILANDRLSGTLQDLGYDAPTGSVVVRFDALRRRGDTQIETRRFEATVPGIAPVAAAIGPALDQAANDVAAQVAAWIGQG